MEIVYGRTDGQRHATIRPFLFQNGRIKREFDSHMGTFYEPMSKVDNRKWTKRHSIAKH